MINIFSNKFNKHPCEVFEAAGVSVLDWLDEHVGVDRRPVPLWSVHVNGEHLLPYSAWAYRIQKNDCVDIVIEPRGIETFFLILAVASAAYSFYQYSNLPDTYANSAPKGSNIYDANAQGNRPKLNGLIPENFGTHPVYPDLLNAHPRRYYQDNIEYIDVLMSVGVGEYALQQLLVGDTDVSRYAGDIAYTLFGPGEDVSGHSAHKNWYQSKEVDRLKLETVAEGLGTNWRADFSGTAMTVSLNAAVAAFPVELFALFEILSGAYAGVYRLNATSGPSGEVGDVTRMLRQVGAGGVGYTYVNDTNWFGFISENGEALNWEIINGGINYEGPFALVPDGEVCSEFEFDVNFPRGLATTDKNGALSSKTVALSVQWRDMDVGGAWTNVPSTAWAGATTDELGFTLTVNINTSPIALTGTTVANYLHTFGGAEHRGLILRAIDNPFAAVVVGHNVTVSGFADTALNADYFVRAKDDNNTLYIALTNVESSYVKAIVTTLLSGSEKIQVSGVRPEVQFGRVTPEATDQNTLDDVFIQRIRSRLASKTQYAEITVLAMTLKGTNAIAGSAQNQINGYFTRKLPVRTGGRWGEIPTATHDIAPVVGYLMKNAGYDYTDINNAELDTLHTAWQAAGQTFAAAFGEDITLFEALKRVLFCGFAEPAIEEGKLLPIREGPVSAYNFLYTPDKIAGDIDRNIAFYNTADADGVLVEYFDIVAKKPATILCQCNGQTGLKPQKLRAFGVTDRTQAWRLGMRPARKQWYKPIQYRYPSEMEALNSAYGSSDALCDDLVEGSYQGRVLAVAGTHITLDRNIVFGNGTHSIAFTKPNGEMSSIFTATPGNTDQSVVIDSALGFTPVLDGQADPPSFTFGPEKAFFIHVICRKVTPKGKNRVDVVGEEYIAEVYADDNGNPDYGPALPASNGNNFEAGDTILAVNTRIYVGGHVYEADLHSEYTLNTSLHAAISADGTRLITGGPNSSDALNLYAVNSAHAVSFLGKLPAGSFGNWLDITANGHYCAVARRIQGAFYLFDCSTSSLNSNSVIVPNTAPTNEPVCVAFSAADDRIAVIDTNGTTLQLRVYSVPGAVLQETLSVGAGAACTTLAWSSDDAYLAVGIASAETRTLIIYDTRTWGIHARPSTQPGTVREAKWSTDNTSLAVIDGSKGEVIVYNTADWTVRTLGAPSDTFNAWQLTFTLDGQYCVVPGRGAFVIQCIVYNVSDWTILHESTTEKGFVSMRVSTGRHCVARSV